MYIKKDGQAETYDWLREFDAQINRPDIPDGKTICWDWLPADMEKDRQNYDSFGWADTDIMRAGNVKEKYEIVCQGLDDVLKKHGYERDGDGIIGL